MATILEKIKLLSGLFGGETAFTGPFYVTVDITRRCNLSCLGCRYHSSQLNMLSPGDQTKLDVPFDMIVKLCNELKEIGTTKSLIFIGEGEPFIHSHLFDMISVAKRAGLHVTLLTNGTLLDEARIKLLLDSPPDILKVSLWASTPEEYKKNYPGSNPKNFGSVIEGIKRLTFLKKKRKTSLPSVVLHQPLNRYNYKNLDAMVDLSHETGCNSISFSPFKTRRGELDSSALSPDEEKHLLSRLSRIKVRLSSLPLSHSIDQTLLRYKIGETVWKKLPCYIGWLHARIKVDGTVLPCNPCDLPMGNLQEKSFKEIWNGLPYRTFRSNTLTREGLISIGKHCDCAFCCHLEDNMRVHRLFRWFAPFMPAKGKTSQGISCSES